MKFNLKIIFSATEGLLSVSFEEDKSLNSCQSDIEKFEKPAKQVEQKNSDALSTSGSHTFSGK